MIVAILVASDICDDSPTVHEIDTAMAERARAHRHRVAGSRRRRLMTAGIAKRRFASRPGDPGGWIRAGDAPPAGGRAAVTPAMRGRIKEAAFSRRVTGAASCASSLPANSQKSQEGPHDQQRGTPRALASVSGQPSAIHHACPSDVASEGDRALD
ncbi:hypothetical protein [Nitrobacter winogradskyi]|uniref:hypothetical protein n=1 Tax=Nitrobacter winogradskyi TaxID=913 RepID=UPI0035D48E0D